MEIRSRRPLGRVIRASRAVIQDQRVQRDRTVGTFRLGIGEPVTNAGFGNVHFHCLYVNITPRQSH